MTEGGAPAGRPFRHEAFLYEGVGDFVRGATAFVRDAGSAGEPTLVALPSEKLDLLRRELGDGVPDVEYLDVTRLGANPSRLISAWTEFVGERSAPDHPVRGVSEPMGIDGGGADEREMRQHEALLNVAFGQSPLRLLCPFDAGSLSPEVAEWVNRSHPMLVDGRGERSSSHYVDDDARWTLVGDLGKPDGPVHELTFDEGSLVELRHHVSVTARASGLGDGAVSDLVIAVNEVATNSIRHAGGMGTLATWHDAGILTCEVKDSGLITDPLVGRRRPGPGDDRGRGLWLANQLCYRVQIRSGPDGTVVRLAMRVPES